MHLARSVSFAISLLMVTTLLVAVGAPCMESSCVGECCEEIAPAQQVSAIVQSSVPIQPGHSVSTGAPCVLDAVATLCSRPVCAPCLEPPDHLVSRLRI